MVFFLLHWSFLVLTHVRYAVNVMFQALTVTSQVAPE